MTIVERLASPLDTEVQYLKGVGPTNAKLFEKIGVRTVRDLLYHTPRRYEDRTNLPPIGSVSAGQYATVRGRVVGFDGKPTRGGKVVLKAAISDSTGTITLVWFNQPWIRNKLSGYRGEIIAYGLVRESGWAYEIHGPEYELIDEESTSEGFASIVPVYPSTEGLRQSTIRRAVSTALERFGRSLVDALPEPLRRDLGLKPLGWSLKQIHHPSEMANTEPARRRLVFEEFLYMQIVLEQKRLETRSEAGIPFPIEHIQYKEAQGELALWAELEQLLHFSLTGAQKRVIGEVWADMQRPYPMNRLIQGDVGSGKTVVAAAAILAAARCGYQSAIMAPTEILAEQHYMNLRKLFEPVGIEVGLFVGKASKSKKADAAAKTRQAKTHVAVGTHALIQESVEFQNLGLAIIDEQHRFGVMQRAALRRKGLNPDVLVMTATPIPRTLAMTTYGDMDVSVIDEMPPGRKPIKTHWKRLDQRERVYEQARELCKMGRQVYFLCPMVAESEKLQAQAAEDLYYRLSKEVYPELRVGLLHGQLKPKEKEEVMERFRIGEIQVMVATTVIEVGVDVPNASVMVIEDANRFGLAQLHQLRGRVGRGEHQSFCILLADASNDEARARLEIMVQTNDGFRIAEEDLAIRGAGDLLGTKQSGAPELIKLGDLAKDLKLLEGARQAAQKLVARDPNLELSEHSLIRERIRFQRGEDADLLVS